MLDWLLTDDAGSASGAMLSRDGVGIPAGAPTTVSVRPNNTHYDGLLSDGLLSDGLLSDGLLSDGLLSDGLLSDGLLSDGCR